MDYNNLDEILTNRVRGKINDMKKEKESDSNNLAFAIGNFMGVLAMAAAKTAVLISVVWVGWYCCEIAFQFPTANFWQIGGILAGLRCLSMFLIDPYVKKEEKK
jgi:hypothetical protein